MDAIKILDWYKYLNEEQVTLKLFLAFKISYI